MGAQVWLKLLLVLALQAAILTQAVSLLWKMGFPKGGKGMWTNPDDMWAMQEQMMYMMMEMKGKGKGGFFDMKGKGKGKGMGMKGMGNKGKSKTTRMPKREKSALKTEQAPMLPWKSRLAQAYSKKYKKPPTKESHVYKTRQEGDGFLSVVTSDSFPSEYQSESVQESEKFAEESAAMVALREEYPEVYAAVPVEEQMKGALACLDIIHPDLVPGGTAEKRKTPGSDASDAKHRLQAGLMIVLDRCLTSGEVVYTATEENEIQVGTVTLNCFDPPQTFTGQPVEGRTKEAKREAHFSAALEALANYQATIDEKMPEVEARKAAKKALHEAKRAEKQAQAAAA